MHTKSRRTARYFDSFTNVGAHDVTVHGLPPRSAGTHAGGGHVLSSIAGLFTVGHDIADLLPDGAHCRTRKLLPARPATQSNNAGPEWLAIRE